MFTKDASGRGVLKRRDEAQREVTCFADKYRRARDTKLKQSYLEEWHWERRMFDIINDVVGPRNKAPLENRTYAEGASREVKVLAEINQSRTLRSEYVAGSCTAEGSGEF